MSPAETPAPLPQPSGGSIRWPRQQPDTQPAAATPADDPQRAEILVVCTANICRSRIAEELLRAALDGEGDIVVRSAGVRARPGIPIAPQAAEVLAARGVPVAEVVSRPAVASDIAVADLILTATRDHRAAVVAMVPQAARRTFTLREFAWLLSGSGGDVSSPDGRPGRLRSLVRWADGQRGLRQPGAPTDFDLDDPYGGPPAGYRQTTRVLAEVVAVLADRLR